MFLTLHPQWSIRQLTPEETQVTNTLYEIFQTVITGRRSLARQITDVNNRGGQTVPLATGNSIDELFKKAVLRAKGRGKLPNKLQVTQRGVRGPDVWLDRVAWDVTTGEEGRDHIKRDVHRDQYRWDIYFFLGY